MDRVTSMRPTLTPGAQRIADAIIRDPAAVSRFGIVDFARSCNSSTGSVNRFCHALGLQGYAQLRLLLAGEVGKQSATDPDFDPSGTIEPGASAETTVSVLAASSLNAIRRTAGLLDTAALDHLAEAIEQANRLQLFAFGGSAQIAAYLAAELAGISVWATTTTDVTYAAAQAVTLDERDVALAISHSGISQHVLDLVAIARERGSLTAAITSSTNTPLSRAVDISLATTARSASLRYRGTAGRHAQLFVSDALFVRIAQRRPESAEHYLELAGAATQQYLNTQSRSRATSTSGTSAKEK